MNFSNQLSAEMKQTILSYLIPEPSQVRFDFHLPSSIGDFYDSKYEIAYIESEVIRGENETFLSSKGHKRRRFYLTIRCFVRACNSCGKSLCISPYCEGVYTIDMHYTFHYIGTSLVKALLYFCFIEDKK